MKNLNTIIAFAFILITTNIISQEANEQIIKETIVRNYTIEKGTSTIPYKVHIKNKEVSEIDVKKEDQYRLNQSRAITPEMITKIIRIDDDADHFYDNTIALSYLANDDNNFKIHPTKEGFVIEVKGQELSYNVAKKDYSIKKLEEDFFKIEKVENSK